MDETDPILTVDKVAAMLRLNPQTVRNTIDRGELTAVRVGPRRVRVRQSALDQFIAESAAMMGPTVDEAQAEFDAALAAVQTRRTTPSGCRHSAAWPKASTKLAAALPRRQLDESRRADALPGCTVEKSATRDT